MEFRTVAPDSPGAVRALRAYVAELESEFGFAGGTAVAHPARA